MAYSTKSELSRWVCEEIQWTFSMHALETMKIKDVVHVRGTALKPDEARHLEGFCENMGYHYHGPFAR